MPLNLDRQFITVLQKTRTAYVFAECTEADACRAVTVEQIKDGQFDDIVAVIEFNPVEGTSRVVTEDIARDVARSLDGVEAISVSLHEFIAEHAGLAYVRGLRVYDRTMAA